ncbi:hypothetical protein NE865_06367 [Phthorimaea operculella]|nr:hypothetical protein NE865_06367 [Phthorimaea operculella]
MQIRLRGSARQWYDDLEEYADSWSVWKDMLIRAFPRSTDYVDRLEEMLGRIKNNNETMTQYYHDKMSLLKKCGFNGENATSCLIRGLPVELQTNAKAFNCESPDQLYYGFLSSLENYKEVEIKTFENFERIQTKPEGNWRRGAAITPVAPRICYLCREPGHQARDCRSTPCQICQRPGHVASACSFSASTAHQQQTSQRLPQSLDNKSLPEDRGTRPLQDGRVLQPYKIPASAPSIPTRRN